MRNLRKDTIIPMAIGGDATIIEKMGEGGQGEVYRVMFGNKKYALKWYFKSNSDSFYNNLKQNISNGSPSPSFLWPLFLTKKNEEGQFGYLMELKDSQYNEFSDFLLAKVKFATVSAMITAAINICVGFRSLHNKGYSYQDLNDGNFFINPSTGDVKICDNDNVAPTGVNTGILGKCRYMAPEIVVGQSLPNAQSDRYSLSVILFLLFFGGHPLEGSLVSNCPCMTEKNEKKYYGVSPVFIFDPKDESNRPVIGVHTNVINVWPQVPEYVRTMFIEQFSKESLHQPEVRKTEKEWLQNVLLRMKHELVNCPQCGEEVFMDLNKNSFQCTSCSFQSKNRPPIIQAGDFKIVVNRDKTINRYVTDNSQLSMKKSGIIVESKKNPGVFALRNLTTDTWTLTKKDASSRLVAPNEVAPLLVGNIISFGNGNSIKII